MRKRLIYSEWLKIALELSDKLCSVKFSLLSRINNLSVVALQLCIFSSAYFVDSWRNTETITSKPFMLSSWSFCLYRNSKVTVKVENSCFMLPRSGVSFHCPWPLCENSEFLSIDPSQRLKMFTLSLRQRILIMNKG